MIVPHTMWSSPSNRNSPCRRPPYPSLGAAGVARNPTHWIRPRRPRAPVSICTNSTLTAPTCSPGGRIRYDLLASHCRRSVRTRPKAPRGFQRGFRRPPTLQRLAFSGRTASRFRAIFRSVACGIGSSRSPSGSLSCGARASTHRRSRVPSRRLAIAGSC